MKKKLKILVTGGSGFLGKNLINKLSLSGHIIINYDIIKLSEEIKGVTTIIGDLLDYNKLLEASVGVDYIYHLAAYADIDKAKNDPIKTMNINVLGTTYLLEASRQNKIKKIIFSSSIYVSSRSGGFYRVSKHACELLLEEYHRNYDLNYNILRFGTLYGPHSNKSNSVYNYLRDALLKKHIKAIGTGEEVREYIDVRDASNVCESLLYEKNGPETILLTGNHRMRLRELLEMINEILHNKVTIEYGSGKSSHYKYTPYSYQPNHGKKLVMNSFRDLGQGLVEILEEIDNKNFPKKD